MCRQRVYNEIKDDTGELDRIERIGRRVQRNPPRDEQIQMLMAGVLRPPNVFDLL